MSANSQRSHGVVESAGNRLRDKVFTAVATLSCEFHDGVLILRGRSTSYYSKQMAQEAVREVNGVARVVNEIEVITQAT
jgi:osmotically-inducible protein OsmY